MADAFTSRRWQVFMVLGLIACVASFYFVIGGGTFAAVSGLVTISIALLNAFLSPATAKKGENWFVGAMKRTLVVGRYAKVVCVALWIVAFINAAVLARAAYEKIYRVDIEGIVIDKLRGTPLEKALVTLNLANGASLASDAPAGRFKFAAVDRRTVARSQAKLEAVCEGVHGEVPVDLSRGSVKDVRIVLSVSVLPTKRMFFVLKGHAVDIFVRDKKLPTELEAKLGGNIFLVETPVFRELRALMDKFSDRIKESEHLELDTEDRDSEKLNAQTKQHQAALKKIEREELKRLTRSRVLVPAGGSEHDTNIFFDEKKLPPTFFANAPWSIDISELGEARVEEGGAKSGDSTRLEIPLQFIKLTKFATKADFDALQRAQFGDNPENRFIEYVSRNGLPSNFLLLSVEENCDGGASVELTAPALQLRVVVLENITEKPIELGEFHFRVAAPAPGERLVRTTQENTELFAGRNSNSEAWYRPRVLRPGEKLAVPLELILGFSRVGLAIDSTDNPDEYQKERLLQGRVRSHQCAERLSAEKEIRTIAISYLREYLNAAGDTVIKSKQTSQAIPKQKFIDGLQREPLRIAKTTEFVYGPSITLDAIDVNGAPYGIEPFNPASVSYFSGINLGIGSCPFVYCRGGADDKWLRQGSILRGRKSKALEGTGELTVRGFEGVLRVSEEEAEISYIDEFFVRARSVTGENVRIQPADERLAHKDGRYVVLKKGESIDINFAIPSGVPLDQVRVSASGYFEPRSPTRGRVTPIF
jgi:hypothetical protein